MSGKVLILQFDSRPAEELGPRTALMRRNRAYCERHGYQYQFVNAVDVALPVYWLKPFLVGHFLAQGFDYVAWLDTDAIFHDAERRVEAMFLGDEAMVAAPDNPNWDSPFNAGVFFTRGARAATIMKAWGELFPQSDWRIEGSAWVCEGEWAGDSFEQGTFTKHLYAPLVSQGLLRLEDWRTLQAPYPFVESYTLHFPRGFAVNIPLYLRST